MGTGTAPLGASMRALPVMAAVVVSACGPGPIASAVPDRPTPASPAPVPGPVVPAGSLFTARLDRALDSFYTLPGTPFGATVVTPLTSPSGAVAVPYGAAVRGFVASTGTPSHPSLVLAVTSVGAAAGASRTDIAVREVQHVLWRGPPTLVAAYEGTAQPSEVYVPAGALMELVLERPIPLR